MHRNVREEDPSKVPRTAQVKNKAPAPVQITAEQLLREANERREMPRLPRPRPVDAEDAYERLLMKRRAFEDSLRRNRQAIGTWLKYAAWEETQKEFNRARSIYERALEFDSRNITVWLKYCELEMKNKNVNLARNVWNRAITILPRVEQFWYKYAYMEEMLGNVAGVRQIFERWMQWDPPEQVWGSFIKFEKRYKEIERVRHVFERFIAMHPSSKNWNKYAKFEEEQGRIDKARAIFERAINEMDQDSQDQKLYVAFAKFETRMREYERARIIYKHALSIFSREKAESLYNNFSLFEKQHGSKAGIEDIVVTKRRLHYEEMSKKNPSNYDTWFDFIQLEEANGTIETTRGVFERAIQNVPPVKDKIYWRRYIYLWIYYAIFEELQSKDFDRARQVYISCLKIIPHKTFTFAKIWFLYAQFLIRRMDLGAARKTLGSAIGSCPKVKLFSCYIELELSLREFDRCRKLYEKCLEFSPESVTTWMKYTELERLLGDTERARAIFELSIRQNILDMPELLWKSFIDFEFENGEIDRTRLLYERLLDKTEHVKVWISYATFESSQNDPQRTRSVYQRGYDSLKAHSLNEERLVLLEAWKEYEISLGDEVAIQEIVAKFPKKVKRKKPLTNAEGVETGSEEYFDYVFPDDQSEAPHLKLLELAHKWKKSQVVSAQ